MQILREHYERQETEALLELAGKELTDEARDVLHSILAARGVGEAGAAAEGAGHMERAAQQHAEAEIRKQLATRGERAIAFLLDAAVVGAPLIAASVQLNVAAPVLIWMGYFFVRDAIPKVGAGKRLMGLRVVSVHSGRACTLGKSVLRNLTHGIFWIDLAFILGERRMRLGDHIADTRVIRVPA